MNRESHALPEPTTSAVDTPFPGAASPSHVTVRCRGVRGSIPSPGPETVRYGGNTSCVEVCHGSARLTLDAGSGIRSLGLDLVTEERKDHVLLLTHYHWDHIQGFPFFGPLYDAESTVRVFGPGRKTDSLRELFERQMDPRFFPVPLDAAAAELRFVAVESGSVELGLDDVSVQALRVKHPSHVLGYRVEVGGRVVCYVPDNELEGDGYEGPADWRERMVAFAGDADVLIHDAMYTDAEYLHRRGWGHSTYTQTMALAAEAGVGRVLFFHHDPGRADDELDHLMGALQTRADDLGLVVEAAAEGAELRLGVDE